MLKRTIPLMLAMAFGLATTASAAECYGGAATGWKIYGGCTYKVLGIELTYRDLGQRSGTPSGGGGGIIDVGVIGGGGGGGQPVMGQQPVKKTGMAPGESRDFLLSLRSISNTDDVDVESREVAIRGIWPVAERVALFGRAGYARISTDGSGFPDKDWTPMYGVGVEYRVREHIGLRVEWDEYDLDTSSNSLSAGAFFRVKSKRWAR